MSRPRSFDEAWLDLHPAFRRGLELAHESLTAAGLAVGAVLTDGNGEIVAEGRNRAYDPPGGRDELQGSPLAHAEMNVLAAVRTERDLAACTLWSTQEPCSMCAAAAAFTGVGAVRFMAPDPWALAAGVSGSAASRSIGPVEDLWIVCANLLFLCSVGRRVGLEHDTVVRNREVEPETACIVVELFAHEEPMTQHTSVAEALSKRWDRITAAAEARTRRRSRSG